MLSVLYVRREVRDLSDEDREAFISAMLVLYTTNMADGVELYGSNFKNSHYFTQIHLQASAEKQCDHWHDGATIVTTHFAISLEFEEALQVVDPSVALNYWDYSYDEYLYGTEFRESEIFGIDWFGEAFPDSSDYTQTVGRWSEVYLGTKEDLVGVFPAESIISNAYGLLRSPWNTQSTSKFTRYPTTLGYASMTLPSCVSLYEMYAAASYGVLASKLNGLAHGPAHIAMGGQWGENTDPYVALDVSTPNDLLLMSKNLWRMGYASCPSSCDDDDDCSCSCPSLDSASEDYKDDVAYNILFGSFCTRYLAYVMLFVLMFPVTFLSM